MKRFFDGYPSTAHPMAILSAMVCSLSSYYPEALDVRNKEMNDITIARLLAKVRTIAAFSYKKSIGQPFVYPQELAQLLRELPQHDVLGPGRAVRDRRGHREGAEPAPHPARRPRAELLAPRRCAWSAARRPTCSPRRRRHLRAVGPAARRRQPGGRSRCCESIQRRRRRRPRSSSSWPRRRTRASA